MNVIRRAINFSKIGRKLLISKFSKNPWPVSVSLHVTRFCDLKCTHCYAVLETLHKPDPTTDQILDVIDGLHKRGTLSVRLLGGEPLIRNDLDVFIRRLKKHGMFCEIVTNATLLKKRIKDWPKAIRMVDSICISLDGNKSTHETIRGKGSFETTMLGVYAALQEGLPLRLHGTTAKESFEGGNQPPQHFLAELAKKYDIPFNIATYCPNPSKDLKQDTANRLSFKQGQSVYKDLLNYQKQGVPVTTSRHILEKGIEWFKYSSQYILYGDESVIPPGLKRCQAGIKNCFIDSDGCMYSCIPHWKKGISVYKEGLDAAYAYMRNHREKVKCQVCYNLQQWEYSKFFTASDPRLLVNMFRNIVRLHFKKKRRPTRTIAQMPPASKAST